MDLNSFSKKMVDILFPPQCAICAEPVHKAGNLCANCWADVEFVSSPTCACCGLPFDYEMDVDMLCGKCIASPPTFAQARSVFLYNAASKEMVLSYKHGDRTDRAPVFAAWMQRVGAAFLNDCDYVIPVPLHRSRLHARRFNQAALLADILGSEANTPVIQDMLIRHRPTPTQGSKSAKGRFRNVEGAFVVSPRWRKNIQNSRILLIDDVFTTGATVNACSKALIKSGAARVNVLTLCRVAGSTQLNI